MLYLSLDQDWFGEHTLTGASGVTLSAREIFESIDVILTVVAAIAVAMLVVAVLLSGRAAEIWSFLTFLAGAVATSVVLLRLVAQPGANEQVDIESGAWLGLVACLAVAIGGWMAMRAVRTPSRRETPETATT